MFEHENEYREDEISDGKNSDDIFDENSDDENGDEDNESMNSTFFKPSALENLEEGPKEHLDFKVFVPCRDHWLRNDKYQFFLVDLGQAPESYGGYIG